MLEWLGTGYDTKHFDSESVNEKFLSLDEVLKH